GRPRLPVQPAHGRGRAVLFLGAGQLRGGHRARALRRGRGRGDPRGGAGHAAARDRPPPRLPPPHRPPPGGR
ncbi:hypothetical protein CCS92_32875, partial [Methylobacterium radiotolerans]